ncbi:MAG: glycoside hydrolase family 57 protein [Candidatus Aenigmarchaeota archaeon]|nr:glycoside hydrolase family 57 protein [Candidatus Aenigmarchaeota archaeon]
MASISLNFQVHQPFRLAAFQPNGNISNQDIFSHYFNHGLDKLVFDRVANRCYFPTNKIILELIDQLKHEKRRLKVSYSISGVFLELCEMFNKDLLESFKQLAETKCVEFLGETYYHSLSSLFEHKGEFIEQVNMHKQAIKDLLNFKPRVFVNTEMIYNNLIAKIVEDLGFEAIFTEGTERILGWRSPNYVYLRKFCFPGDPRPEKRIKVLLRNYRLSDDIGYRFSAKDWDEWPLTADKFAAWLAATPGHCINLFMDYETFGEHQWQESGIFWFLKALPFEILKYENLEFSIPSEVVKKHEPVGEIDVFELSTVSWADMERDVSAWLGNRMQQVCFEELKNLEQIVKRLDNKDLTKIWRLLQISDHLYYICTKWWNDGDVHKYFSCFPTPQDGFANFMEIISDLKARVITELTKGKKL